MPVERAVVRSRAASFAEAARLRAAFATLGDSRDPTNRLITALAAFIAVRRVMGEEVTSDKAFFEVRAKAEAIVNGEWQRIEALADQIRQKGEIDVNELADLL